MQTTGGRLLLLLASCEPQTVTTLIRDSGLPPAETLRQLHRLVDRGFVLALAEDGAVGVYHLNPKGVRTDHLDPHQRILLVEDDLDIEHVTMLILEEEGYAVIATHLQADAAGLLKEIAFDLVLTDSFSATRRAALTSATDLLTAAGATPVVLFTAHQVELDAARAAGFRDLILKPFGMATLEQTVRALLNHPPGI